MKKILSVILALLSCLLLAVSAVAEEIPSTRTVSFSVVNRTGTLAQSPDSATFWECPALSAGQMGQTGKLILHNASQNSVVISLKNVVLPYKNDTALDYLNHLIITVSDGDKVLYDGTYSRINDKKGLAISEKLAAGKDKTYTVSLRCDFTYTGDATQAASQIKWQFGATTDTATQAASQSSTQANNEERVPTTALWIFIISAVVIALCAVMGEILTRQKKKK